ncbi:MAG: sel1 repeat family protein [Sphingomonadales bacterium]|nr:MAG: sel1 repeat family protein [Sphingomonadales bacterium]TNF02349.1 MAG: sel1 repeat family protein [Sphingomonadales bacterium]
MANSMGTARFLMESRIADAACGNAQACYELGIAYSCGTGEVDVDLVAAHKWFNLAALGGSEEGQALRAEIAGEMTARQVAEAQRQARAWLAETAPRGTA